MIVTRLTGRLGNQLFQYAAGRSLAERLGVELVLDSSWIDGEGEAGPGTDRRYRLGCFELTSELVPVRRIARLPPRSRLGYHAERLLPSRRPRLEVLVEERTGELDRRIFSARDDTCLLGFWESERYFVDQTELIRADLRFPGLPPSSSRLADEIAERNVASVHVRRGDKARDPGVSRKYASIAASWYPAALDELVAHAGPVDTVYVFSDDPGWCRENLALAQPTVVVEGNPEHEDLRLMSLCRSHVISNSTFGWWGAWLDPRPDKVVVAPATWRTDRPTPDAVPPGWIQVPN